MKKCVVEINGKRTVATVLDDLEVVSKAELEDKFYRSVTAAESEGDYMVTVLGCDYNKYDVVKNCDPDRWEQWIESFYDDMSDYYYCEELERELECKTSL